MMRNKTSAMPNDRIQLSNHRPNTERGFDGGDGSPGAVALWREEAGAPKSCM